MHLKKVYELNTAEYLIMVFHDPAIDYFEVAVSIPYRQRYLADNRDDAIAKAEYLADEICGEF